MSNFWKRTTTIILAVPFLWVGIFRSEIVFFILILVSSICIAYELLEMARIRTIPVYRFVTFFSVVLIIVYFYCIQSGERGFLGLIFWVLDTFGLEYQFVNCVVVFSCIVIFALKSFTKDLRGTLETVAVHVFILGYAGVALGYILWIREISLYFLVYVIGVTWITDIGAYCIGKYFGKYVLGLPVSPHKTLEGFLGGMFLALVFGVALKVIIPFYGIHDYDVFGWGFFVSMTGVLSLIAILGDLAESALKRSVDLKDSHDYIPGHGGMMDVMDSLIYTGPVFYFIIRYYFW